MELQYYKDRKEILNNQIAGFISALSTADLSAADLAHVIKAVELIGNPQSWHEGLLSALNSAVSRLALLAVDATDRLYVSRAMMACDQHNRLCDDADFISLHNEVEIGERRFDCFSDRILEKYYEEYNSC